MAALFTRAGALLVAGAMMGVVSFLACSSDDPAPATNAEGGVDAEPLFRIVQRDLVVRCGGQNGSCHVRGATAPHWLGDPDPYLSAKKYPGILPATLDVGDSIILTQVAHSGPSLKSFPQLYDATANWLRAEVPGPPLPNTGAFFVRDGLNSIPLDNVASGLTDARLTFIGTDGSNGTMVLSSMRLVAPRNANIKVDSPFFVILPRSGKVKAEPEKNGFKGELTVPAGQSVDLFEGRMVLTGWDAQGQLKIVFNKIESSPGTSPSDTCTALDVFTAKAIPAMTTQIDVTDDDDNDGGVFDGSVVGKNSCAGCHSRVLPDGTLYAAVLAMDLRELSAKPEVACASARAQISFANKSQSNILLNPQGKSNPNHPIIPLAADNPVIKGIQEWVEAEQQ